MVEAGAGIVAWLGASLVVLGDGRRGLAAGIALAAAGLGAIAWVDAGPIAAAAIAVGGSVATAGRLRTGAAGWRIMPPGSTPRLVLCIAVGLVGLWLAFAITTGAGAGTRFAALTCLVLPPARILWSDETPVQITATGVLALAVAAGSSAASGPANVWPYIAAAVLAGAAAWLPLRTPSAA